MTFALVALAGALGAPARFVLERAVTRVHGPRFPWGTWIVNVTGAFALGIVTGLSIRHGLSASAAAIAGSGFLGAYTTFSTFTIEAIRASADPASGVRTALRYVASSVAVGIVAAIAGLAATGAF